jgi:MOSC domain-containing protein YiiM
MKQELTGSVIGTYLARDPHTLISTAEERLEVSFEGLLGDRHYGYSRPADARTPQYKYGTPMRNNRQASIVSVEEMGIIASNMGIPEVKSEWLGANLLFEGIPNLTLLPPATRLVFPTGTVLVVEGENFPCSGPARVIQGNYPTVPGLQKAFPRKAMHLRGIVSWVERPGVICPGDSVRVILPEQRVYSIGT